MISENKWLEVNLDHITHNFKEIKKLIAPNTKILGVVKGNAYGHGIVEISKHLAELGVNMLGVSNLQEAIELREGGIGSPILLLAPIEPIEATDVINYNITPSVFTLEVVRALSKVTPKNRITKVHLKVDTGMGRYGLLPEDALEMAKIIEGCGNLELEGIYSHYANAHNNDLNYCQEQLIRFNKAVEALAEAEINPPIKHICNSAGLIIFPESQQSMVRIGNLLYGFNSTNSINTLDLKKAALLKARVKCIREVKKGFYLGYGKHYKSNKKGKIAYLPIGRVDGYTDSIVLRSGNIKDLISQTLKLLVKNLFKLDYQTCLVNGVRCRIVGKIGMQFTMVDVTGVKGIREGMEAEFSVGSLALKEKIPRIYLSSSRSIVEPFSKNRKIKINKQKVS